jgi:S-DNA-T family DNA segregation ATPase FtsK/SpoIIIE
MTKRQLLEWQADRIETTLAQYGLTAHVTGGTVSPRWVQFKLWPGPGTRVRQIRDLAEELALALNADTCRVARKNGLVMVEVPRADPQPVRLLPLQQSIKEAPFGTATLGLTDDGRPLLIRLPAPQVAHLLIAGTTGSGKSALAQTIIASLAMRHHRSELGFVLIDPKRRAFGPLAALPHLVGSVVVEPDEAATTLARLVRLMLDRDRQSISMPRIVVVIDELADLLISAGKSARDPLTRLAQRGREAGIHLVACTQKPTNKAVDGLAKANFPVRLVGQVTSPEEAKVATGYGGTGADRLRGPGDFIAVTGGQVIRFQSAYVPPQQLCELVTRLAQSACPAVGIDLPEVEHNAPLDDKLEHYVDQVRDLWPTLLKEDGSLRWKAKTDIAERIFGQRTTAGNYGRIVNRVIERLRAEGTATYAQTTTLSQRRLSTRRTAEGGLERWSRTTTTTMATLRRAFSRFASRVRVVVVVFDWSRNRFYRITFPRLWGASRLVIIYKAGGAWAVERVR